MDTLGRHVIVDLWGCAAETLSSKEVVERWMVEAAMTSNADIREVIFHQFEPHGVSGVVVISESHLSIHTFPEHGYASLDVYTCGGMNPHVAMKYMADKMAAEKVQIVEVIRGEEDMKIEKHPTIEKEKIPSY